MRNIARCCRPWCRRLAVSYLVWLGLASTAHAQPIVGGAGASPTLPAMGQSPLTLADCVRVGLERQPALAAQRASIAAAQAQRKALDNLVCMSLLSRELGYRKEQAALGITIAQAGLDAAEWDTIYGVTYCYFMAVYASQQESVAKGLLEKLDMAKTNAQRFVDKGDPDALITQVDVDKLAVNSDLLRLRLVEASVGVQRATAALREAIGWPCDAPLPLALDDFPDTGDAVDRSEVIHLALARRGEMVQAQGAFRLAELEVCAQNAFSLLPFKKTFAAAADIHSKSIPQGSSDGTYRPSAIGIEMPTILVGHRADRVSRAQDLSSRACAVVEKTQNLIALEAEDAFHRWQTAAAQVKIMRESAPKSAKLAELISGRFDNGKVTSEDYIRARTLHDQTQSQLNEALLHNALALAALERVTAGGFTPNFRRQHSVTLAPKDHP